MKKSLVLTSIAAFPAFLVSGSASAQILSPEIIAEIEAVGTDLTGVGVAIIGLAVIALAIRWVKATFF